MNDELRDGDGDIVTFRHASTLLGSSQDGKPLPDHMTVEQIGASGVTKRQLCADNTRKNYDSVRRNQYKQFIEQARWTEYDEVSQIFLAEEKDTEGKVKWVPRDNTFQRFNFFLKESHVKYATYKKCLGFMWQTLNDHLLEMNMHATSAIRLHMESSYCTEHK